MTMDLRIDRVRVIVNQDNIVVVEPRRGYLCLLNTFGIFDNRRVEFAVVSLKRNWSVDTIVLVNDCINLAHFWENDFCTKVLQIVNQNVCHQTTTTTTTTTSNLIRNRFQVFKVLYCLHEMRKRTSIRIPYMSLLVAEQALFIQNPRQNGRVLLQHLFIILSKETLDIISGIRHDHQKQIACSLIHSLLRHHSRFRREQRLKRGREHVLHHIYPSFPQFPLLGFLSKNAQIPADFSPKYCVDPSRTSRQW